MCLSVLVWVLMINMFVYSLWIFFKASKLSLAYAVMHMFGCLSMCLRLIFVFHSDGGGLVGSLRAGWKHRHLTTQIYSLSKTLPAHSVDRVTM